MSYSGLATRRRSRRKKRRGRHRAVRTGSGPALGSRRRDGGSAEAPPGQAVGEASLDLDAGGAAQGDGLAAGREVDHPVTGGTAGLHPGLLPPTGYDDLELLAHQPLVDLALNPLLQEEESLEALV